MLHRRAKHREEEEEEAAAAVEEEEEGVEEEAESELGILGSPGPPLLLTPFELLRPGADDKVLQIR